MSAGCMSVQSTSTCVIAVDTYRGSTKIQKTIEFQRNPASCKGRIDDTLSPFQWIKALGHSPNNSTFEVCSSDEYFLVDALGGNPIRSSHREIF
jgi:hypothetical protein